jgi:hypothetical protein
MCLLKLLIFDSGIDGAQNALYNENAVRYLLLLIKMALPQNFLIRISQILADRRMGQIKDD